MAEVLLTEQIFRAKFEDQMTSAAQEAVDKTKKMFEDLATSMKLDVGISAPGAPVSAPAGGGGGGSGVSEMLREAFLVFGNAQLETMKMLKEFLVKDPEAGKTLADKKSSGPFFGAKSKEMWKRFFEEGFKTQSLFWGFVKGRLLGPAFEELGMQLKPILQPFIDLFRSILGHPEVRKVLGWFTVFAQQTARTLSAAFGTWANKHIPVISNWLMTRLPGWVDSLMKRWKGYFSGIQAWFENLNGDKLDALVQKVKDFLNFKIGGKSIASWFVDMVVGFTLFGVALKVILSPLFLLASALGMLAGPIKFLIFGILTPAIRLLSVVGRFLLLNPIGLLIAGLSALFFALNELVPGADFLDRIKNAGKIIWDYWADLFTDLGEMLSFWIRTQIAKIPGASFFGLKAPGIMEWRPSHYNKKGVGAGGTEAEKWRNDPNIDPVPPSVKPPSSWWGSAGSPASPSAASSSGGVADLLAKINGTLKEGFSDTNSTLSVGQKDQAFGLNLGVA